MPQPHVSDPDTPAVPITPVTPLSVLQRFRVLIRTAQRHSQWIERQSGVTGAQLWALQELSEAPGLRVGELATRMALHQSTASNMIDKLESSGLVVKERTSADQRVVRLSLTEAGRDLLARAPSPARGVLPEALRLLDGESLGRLQDELDGLLQQIKGLDEGFGMQPLPFAE
ncbi:MarR family winged helix-turn-helix transcriptional regulator [Azoarcus sp. KH32C]|uniref:MarR family winged helix-turn-helix transcriptional regulator n=1 Tax=Azoarcus sp. KH32C TaxID=748247 RepID=UPI00023863AC|nr:MarR family winged helix-turn-helix transcriptional regulator [Azoarcus sp. KH32C]BAL24101.1 transcriptional regulator, MarR family [Azoarcus sp. KH32C]